MKTDLVSVGYGHFVPRNRVIALLDYDSQPVLRFKQNAAAVKKVIDATKGRRTLTLIVVDTGHVILSPVKSRTLARRFEMGGEDE